MNILFLNPPFRGEKFSRTSRSPAVTKGGTLYYPFWLAYAIGVCEKEGHNIRFYDCPAQGLLIKDILGKLDDFIPNLIVIDTSTPSIYEDVKRANEIKDKFNNSFIVLVGTHPSALPEETLELSDKIDAVCVGEYDYTIRDLADALKNGKDLNLVSGLVYRKNNKIIKNYKREKIKDLDNLPFVSSVYKKYLNYKEYFFAAASYPMMMIITGRGCPFRCFFCVYPQVFHSREYRERSAQNVADEFLYIKENFPKIKEIGIEDDCFTANKERVKKICELLIQKKNKLKWYCNVRGDVGYDLLKLMKKAGCRLVTVGFESGSQEILNNMHKGETVEKYYAFAKAAKKAKVLVHGCIMVGNPGDTKEILKQNYEFAKKINCDSMQFYPLYVYPGTEAYEWAKEKGFLKTEKFDEWLTEEGMHNCVLNLDDFTSKEMVKKCDYYMKKYHLRFKYILMKLIQAISNPEEGYRSLKSAKVFFEKLVLKK